MTGWFEIFWWLHVISSCAMAGIIWFVQIVHYPLFRHIGSEEFDLHHVQHMVRTGLLIAPLMLIEMGSGLLILWGLATSEAIIFIVLQPGWFRLSMVMLGLIWLSTFLIQVKYHHQLDGGKDDVAICRLIQTNWLRTILWTVRLALLVAATQTLIIPSF